MYTKKINRLSIKIYYAFYKDYSDQNNYTVCHEFTTNKDTITPDALYVTSFWTNNPSKLHTMIRQYAENRPNEYICFQVNKSFEEFNCSDTF
jgi:hypothetical protein